MERIRQIRERLAAIAAELRTINDSAGERSLDETEQGRWDTLVAERGEAPAEGRAGGGLLLELAGLEARSEMIRRLATEPTNTEPGEDRGAPNLNRGHDPFDLSDVRFGTPPSALRARALTAID